MADARAYCYGHTMSHHSIRYCQLWADRQSNLITSYSFHDSDEKYETSDFDYPTYSLIPVGNKLRMEVPNAKACNIIYKGMPSFPIVNPDAIVKAASPIPFGTLYEVSDGLWDLTNECGWIHGLMYGNYSSFLSKISHNMPGMTIRLGAEQSHYGNKLPQLVCNYLFYKVVFPEDLIEKLIAMSVMEI